MAETAEARAVELLIEQADDSLTGSRYAAALAAAERAAEAAAHLNDTNLLLRTLEIEADALRMSGSVRLALVRYTRILGLANDPAVTARLDDLATQAIARAYANWVVAARYAGGVPVRDMFGVLDAADRWLTATGHPDWRAPVLLQRSALHRRLSEWDQAIAAAQDALAAHRPGTPGYTLATHRFELGDVLRLAGRPHEAELQYQAILDDATTSAYDRSVALRGLTWCALARGDPDTAAHHARSAVQLAEPLGDEPALPTLAAQIAVHRATGDLEAAAQAAARSLDAARRIGTHYRLFYALFDAVDVALDRGDHSTAATLLEELDRHATALDADTSGTAYRDEAADLRAHLPPEH